MARLVYLLPRDNADRAYGGPQVREEIKKAAEPHLFKCREILVPDTDNALFALSLSKCEAVVLDVRGDTLPHWVFAYIYGRLIPSIKLVHLHPNELSSEVVRKLPPLVEALQMDQDEPGVESVIYWRQPDDLVHQLGATFKKLDDGPLRFKDQHQGLSYFGSVGRRPARIFISNSGTANLLAGALVEKLKINNIDAFHYKQENAIPVGDDWAKSIKTAAQLCDVFVALIDRGYSGSEWCKKELKIAWTRAHKGEVALFPYNLAPQDPRLKQDLWALLKHVQAPDLGDEQTVAATKVFDAIDAHLKKKQSRRNWQARQPLPLGASREAVIDALRHLPKESWSLLADKLARAQINVRVPATRSRVQPRALAEEFVFEVQRAEIPSAIADKRMSPLSYMIDELASIVPDDRRPPILRRAVERMQEAFQMEG